MQNIVCSVCDIELSLRDLFIYHDACDHYTCASSDCSDGTNATCKHCLENPVGGENLTRGSIEKDRDNDVVCDIACQKLNVPPVRTSLFSTLHKISATVVNTGKTIHTSTNVYWLLAHKIPITLFVKRGFSINDILLNNINIDDLLIYGYEFKDLKDLPLMNSRCEKGEGLPTGVRVLRALDVKPHHFRDHREEMPFYHICQVTGLTKRHLVENMGLRFDLQKGISSPGDSKKTWSIDNLNYLGFETVKDFIDELGMKNIQQWYDLDPQPVDFTRMGMTSNKIKELTPCVISDASTGRYTSSSTDQYMYPVHDYMSRHGNGDKAKLRFNDSNNNNNDIKSQQSVPVIGYCKGPVTKSNDVINFMFS